MSKKECKRVPSYAIRHLIQSLKEKGRTCRKGAEQRIDREILICDPEEEYVRRLAEALLLKKEVTAGVRICSSPEMVQELLKIGLIKVLLISEDVPYEKRKQIFTGKRIILTRQHCVDLGEEEREKKIPQNQFKTVEVVFDHVTFCYKGAEKPVLNDISFSLKSGEHKALVGLNGAGKSTLVKLISGLYLPTKGRFILMGSIQGN